MDRQKLKSWAKANGATGTVVFHAVILLVLIFGCMTSQMDTTEEGLAVSLGADDFGGSDLFEPTPASEIEGQMAEASPAADPSTAPEAYQTQDIEESVAMPKADEEKKKEEAKKKEADAQRKKKQAEEAERKRREAEKRAQIEKENKQKAEIGNRLKNVFGQGGNGGIGNDNSSTGKGDGTSTGSQGKSTGDPNNAPSQGHAKTGSNNSWSLDGRSIRGTMATPTYTDQEEGTIVVRIMVNENGDVINADIAPGTDITSKRLHNAALAAAKKTKFNAIPTKKNQSGTITYKFELR